MANFGQSEKGAPFAKLPKSTIFMAEFRKAEKIGNISLILA